MPSPRFRTRVGRRAGRMAHARRSRSPSTPATFVASALLARADREARDASPPAAHVGIVRRRHSHRHSRRVARRRNPRAVPRHRNAVVLHELHGVALHAATALSDLGLTPTQLGITIGCGGIGAPRGRAHSLHRLSLRWGPRRTLIGALSIGAAAQMLIPLAPASAVGRDGLLDRHPGDRRWRADRLPRQRNYAATAPAAARGAGRAAATWQVAAGLLTPIGALDGRSACGDTSECGPRSGCSRSALLSPRLTCSPPCAARFPAPARDRIVRSLLIQDVPMPTRSARFPPQCATSQRASPDRPTFSAIAEGPVPQPRPAKC